MEDLINNLELFPEGTLFIVDSTSMVQGDGAVTIDQLRQDTTGIALGVPAARLVKAEAQGFEQDVFQAIFLGTHPNGHWSIFEVANDPALGTNGVLNLPPGKLANNKDFASAEEILVTLVGLVARLEQKKSALERCQQVIEKAIGIHKSAIQNAVDIVQTRRIEMNEHGDETNVEGAIAMAIFSALLEFSVISMVGATVIGGVTSALIKTQLKLSHKARLGRILKLQNRRKNFIDDLNIRNLKLAELNTLRDSAAKEVRRRVFSGRKKRKVVRYRLKVVDDKIAQVKKEKVATIFPINNRKQKAELAKLVEANNKEIARINEKASAIRPNVNKATDTLNKLVKFAEAQTSAYKGKITFSSSSNGLIPVDVVLKTQIENLWDSKFYENKESLELIVRTITELKDWVSLGEGIEEIASEENFLETLNEAADLYVNVKPHDQLENYADELENEFRDVVGWKWRLSAEYEFMVWALVFSQDIKVTYYKIVGVSTIDLDRKIRQPVNRLEYAELVKTGETGTDVAVTPGEKIKRILPYLNARFFEGKANTEEVMIELIESVYKLPDRDQQPSKIDQLNVRKEHFFDVGSLFNLGERGQYP